ncbi:MAG: hypothetical protein ABH804_03005 [archaeon]
MEKEFTLDDLKKRYKEIQIKHKLPSFEQLNEDFSIEKTVETESEILIREVRRYIGEKFLGYLRFIEMLINPVNSPMFIFSIIKTLNLKDREKLNEIYKKLSKMQIKFLELDVDFSEEKEAVFIRESYTLWQEIKRELLEIVETINKNWDNKIEKEGKGYFG